MNERNNETRKEAEQIDLYGLLADYLRVLSRMWLWVVLLAAVGGILFFIRDYTSWSPRYTASSVFTVSISSDTQNSSGASSFYASSTADQMEKTFPYILTSGVLSRRAAAEMGQDHLSGTINASAEPNTNLFTMSVTDSDAQRAYDTLQAVIKCYPEVAEAIVGRTSLTLLDESGVPVSPDNPRNSQEAMKKGAAAGAAVGLAWTLFVMLSRRTVRRKNDIPRYINVKCLGEIPQVSLKKRSRKGKQVLNITDEKINGDFLEAIRLIRNKVEYSAAKNNQKVIMVTSALAGEGKSTVAVNLALSMAQNGKRVVLVDCDLRHPSDREILRLPEGNGLYEVLKGEADIQAVLMDKKKMNLGTDMDFYFVPGGKAVADGSKLLDSRQMQMIVEALKKAADYIILDSAPVGILTDAGILAQYADSAVCIVKKDYARADSIMEGMEELADGHVHVIGGVLNGV